MDTVVPSTGVKPKRREADNTPYCAEVKNMWSYTSTPPYAFMYCIRTALPFYIFSEHKITWH
jgi:hypothetical protein